MAQKGEVSAGRLVLSFMSFLLPVGVNTELTWSVKSYNLSPAFVIHYDVVVYMHCLVPALSKIVANT